MSSESDYLLERVPTNASKLNKGSLSDGHFHVIRNWWIKFINIIGKHYVAEFLATFVLMVS